jgi:hypothetical protein
VASGLATLSITSGQIGSEKFLTLGINSDREARSEAVSGAPDRHDFKTSRGTYFVNITQANFEAATASVEVGCEPKGKN